MPRTMTSGYCPVRPIQGEAPLIRLCCRPNRKPAPTLLRVCSAVVSATLLQKYEKLRACAAASGGSGGGCAQPGACRSCLARTVCVWEFRGCAMWPCGQGLPGRLWQTVMDGRRLAHSQRDGPDPLGLPALDPLGLTLVDPPGLIVSDPLGPTVTMRGSMPVCKARHTGINKRPLAGAPASHKQVPAREPGDGDAIRGLVCASG